jgi:hypothetical protein
VTRPFGDEVVVSVVEGGLPQEFEGQLRELAEWAWETGTAYSPAVREPSAFVILSGAGGRGQVRPELSDGEQLARSARHLSGTLDDSLQRMHLNAVEARNHLNRSAEYAGRLGETALQGDLQQASRYLASSVSAISFHDDLSALKQMAVTLGNEDIRRHHGGGRSGWHTQTAEHLGAAQVTVATEGRYNSVPVERSLDAFQQVVRPGTPQAAVVQRVTQAVEQHRAAAASRRADAATMSFGESASAPVAQEPGRGSRHHGESSKRRRMA